mmetsp:Transcript_11086/g.25700  ORF Transcript_11086/g.25700 Transcript_11086/m.25700 type:complete len:248 (+) Transcript_11086:664-1407(+)
MMQPVLGHKRDRNFREQKEMMRMWWIFQEMGTESHLEAETKMWYASTNMPLRDKNGPSLAETLSASSLETGLDTLLHCQTMERLLRRGHIETMKVGATLGKFECSNIPQHHRHGLSLAKILMERVLVIGRGFLWPFLGTEAQLRMEQGTTVRMVRLPGRRRCSLFRKGKVCGPSLGAIRMGKTCHTRLVVLLRCQAMDRLLQSVRLDPPIQVRAAREFLTTTNHCQIGYSEAQTLTVGQPGIDLDGM